MSDPTDPLAWMQRAEEDWLLARSALRRKVPLIYGTTFHAQQCVGNCQRDDREINYGEGTFEQVIDLLERGQTVFSSEPYQRHSDILALSVRYDMVISHWSRST
jgi:hypothetical protein